MAAQDVDNQHLGTKQCLWMGEAQKAFSAASAQSGMRDRMEMKLADIVAEIETRALGLEIGRLQEIRKALKGKKRLPHSSIFHPDSIKEKDGYAFHYGGRREIQFNVGFEGSIFRHGLAFSFEPSQTLPNIEVLVPNVKRFNEFLTIYPQELADMTMWYWEGGVRSSDHPPASITADLVRTGVFVFIGKVQPSDKIDFDLIAQDLDRLLPLYRFVEGYKTFPETTERPGSKFYFEAGCRPGASSTKASTVARELNIYLRHNDIKVALFRHLAGVYGTENVGTEIANAGGKVDLVVRQGAKFWFYEIKTAMSARGCIREALAQLLEYSFWPGAQVAERLIIVGEPMLDDETRFYVEVLKSLFLLPIEYQQFDLAKGMLMT